MDKFEKIIKDAVEGFEAPYNPQAWENVSQGLGQAAKPWKWIAGGAAAAVIATATFLAVNYNSTEISNEIQNDVALSSDVEINEDSPFASNQELPETAGIQNNTENTEVVSNNLNEESASIITNEEVETTNANETASSNNSVVTNSENNSESSDNNNSVENNTTDENISSNDNNNAGAQDEPQKRYNTTFDLNLSEICEGSSIDCVPKEFYNDVIYLWDFGDGSFAKGEIVSHDFPEAGDYKVTLSLKDKNTNETLGESSDFVQVMDLPNVDFTWQETDNVIPTVKFINLSEESEEFTWNIKGIASSDNNEFEYTFKEKGIYDVSITAKNDNGCENTLSKQITIEEDYNLLAPTAFTPNGDFMNDFFIPEALKIMDQEFVMTIYDEDGQLVYETRNVGEPWDGNYTKDNVPAPDGGYVWIVKVLNNDGQYETYNGQVFITR
ncbi:MAG: gliding motility-associated C-terminal domain-containing protein [Crocinitomicaceae bacterium]|nr:gliding motility-associated C-terminal domain-containing protein [Crocinitomicaceae bacterium]